MLIKPTIFTGKNLLHLEEVDSTNKYAQEYISKTKPIDGTVILAENQKKGRGQSNNIWFSSKGESLTFSIIYLTHDIKAINQFRLNMVVSLGIQNALNKILDSSLRSHLKIKWPNDIYYKYHKLGGILIENTISGSNLKYSIIGIGLNMHQETFPDNLPNPISLQQITGRKFGLKEVLEALLVSIENLLVKLRAQTLTLTMQMLEQQYCSNLLGFNSELFFKSVSGQFSGSICGIEDSGKLVVLNLDSLKKESYDFKEIEFLL